MFLLYYVQVGSQMFWVWPGPAPMLAESFDRSKDVNSSNNTQHQELTSSVSNMRGSSETVQSPQTLQENNKFDPEQYILLNAKERVLKEIEKLDKNTSSVTRSRELVIIGGWDGQNRLRPDDPKVQWLLDDFANEVKYYESQLKEKKQELASFDARLAKYNKNLTDNSTNNSTTSPNIIHSPNIEKYMSNDPYFVNKLGYFDHERQKHIIGILDSNLSEEEAINRIVAEQESTISLRRQLTNFPKPGTFNYLSSGSKEELSLNLAIHELALEVYQAKYPKQYSDASPKIQIPVIPKIDPATPKENTSASVQNPETPKMDNHPKSSSLVQDLSPVNGNGMINFAAIAKYKKTYPDIYNELRKLGDERQKPIMEILDSNLSAKELNEKIAEEQKNNTALKEQVKTTDKDSYSLLWANIHQSDLALEALQAKLKESSTSVQSSSSIPVQNPTSVQVQNPSTISFNNSSSVVSDLEHDIERFKKELGFVSNNGTVVDRAKSPYLIQQKIMDKLNQAGIMELNFISAKPMSEFYYLQERQKRENEIKNLNGSIVQSYDTEKWLQKDISNYKTELVEIEKELKERREYDKKHSVTEDRGVFDLMQREKWLQSTIQRDEKSLSEVEPRRKEDMDKLAKLGDINKPTDEEVKLLARAKDEYKGIAQTQKDLTKIFAELVELRQELDEALGRPKGNYKEYLAYPGASTFTVLAQDLFGITPIRNLGPRYDIPDYLNISFQPQVKKTNQQINPYITQSGEKLTTVDDINSNPLTQAAFDIARQYGVDV